ncbi:MAG: outer membrane beta-barrel protein [Pseudomonadota bacterium]
MKKILISLFIVLGLFAFIATGAEAKAASTGAEKYVAGGFEMSGHLMTGTQFTKFSKRASAYGTFDGDNVYFAGAGGKYIGKLPYSGAKSFNFFVDDVELDIMKSFGENIRLRADLNFGRALSSGIFSPGFFLEQAYATANIPLGNGVEILFGRFNTPIGFEAADATDNDTISKSVLGTALRPTNTTGVKIYYAFSDLVDLHFYVVNTLTQDSTLKVNNVPSLGMRLGFNWGQEGSESTFGISPFFGPETRASNRHFTYGADMDLNWWITEAFALGAEGLYRRDNSISGSPYDNVNYMSGLLNLHYVFSDVWDGTLKYVFAKQFKTSNNGLAAAATIFTPANLTGEHQSIQQIALAGGYSIADGAKLKLEGRFDIVKPVGKSTTQYVYGAAMAFAYNF